MTMPTVPDVARMVIEHGADVPAQTNYGESPFCLAAGTCS